MNVASWGTSRPKPASNSCTISAVTVPQNDAEGRELEADPDWRRDRIRRWIRDPRHLEASRKLRESGQFSGVAPAVSKHRST